jgi:hypothetical protein
MIQDIHVSLTRFFARQAIGGRFLVPGLMVSLVLLLATQTAAIEQLGVFLIAFAIPQAAVTLSMLERDGRLDQLRVTGNPPARLLLTAICGLAGPWLVLGAIVLTAAAVNGSLGLVRSPPVALLLVLLAWAAAATGFAVPRFGAVADPRLSLFALGLLIYLVSLTVNLEVPAELPLRFGVSASSEAAVYTLVILAVSAIAIALPRVRRHFARPSSGSQKAVGADLRIMRAITRAVGPITGRGVLLTFRSALALAALSIAVVFASTSGVASAATAALPYVPLFIGSLAVSVTVAADTETRRLEVMCLAPAERIGLLARMVSGLWLPFILASLGIGLVAWAVTGIPPPLVGVALATCAIVAPLSATEGWHRRAPLAYTLPFLLLVASLTSRIWSWPLRMDSPTGALWRIVSTLLVPLLFGLTWYVAARSIQRPDTFVLRGWTASAALTVLTGAALLPRIAEGVVARRITEFVILSITLVGVAAWFVPAFGGMRSRDRLIPVATVATVSAVLVALSAQRLLVDVATLAILPAAVLWMAMRVHERFGTRNEWSVALRILLAFGVTQWLVLADSNLSDNFAWLASGGAGTRASRGFAVVAAMMLTIALAFEVALTMLTVFRRQSNR